MARTGSVTSEYSANRFKYLPRTRTCKVKSRLTWTDKLRVLCPFQHIKKTIDDLVLFKQIFAFRHTDAIITRASGGPRDWARLYGCLEIDHIARHLLGNRVPTLRPQWVGARSFDKSRFLAVDVDIERSPEQRLSEEFDLTHADEDDRKALIKRLKPQNTKRPFEIRCAQVEDAFRRCGIDPADPNQVLVQSTPSGGRHYFVFFDQTYQLDQYHWLLNPLGLNHCKGEIEFFPSPNQGLRLPFGHIPSEQPDPGAWLRFVHDFRDGRIRHFSLQELNDNYYRDSYEKRAIPNS